MGRRYILSGENLTLGTGNVLATLFAKASGAGSIVEIERVEVSQSATPTLAQARLAYGQRDSAGTLTVTSATPNPIVLGGPSSSIAGGTNALTAGNCGVNSSADSGGTYTNTYPMAFNNIGGESWISIPEDKIILPPSTLFVVRFLTAPGTTTGWTVSVKFHEVI